MAGIPAVTNVTRPLISDTTLMQRERKRDIPGGLWSTATLLVLAIIALLACASHLLVDLPLFAGPAVMVIGAIVLVARSERRRGTVRRQQP